MSHTLDCFLCQNIPFGVYKTPHIIFTKREPTNLQYTRYDDQKLTGSNNSRKCLVARIKSVREFIFVALFFIFCSLNSFSDETSETLKMTHHAKGIERIYVL